MIKGCYFTAQYRCIRQGMISLIVGIDAINRLVSFAGYLCCNLLRQELLPELWYVCCRLPVGIGGPDSQPDDHEWLYGSCLHCSFFSDTTKVAVPYDSLVSGVIAAALHSSKCCCRVNWCGSKGV